MAHRFIPAHAGNGSALHSALYRQPVHPRACGERDLDLIEINVLGGSSPRMRGTVQIARETQQVHRFIPAHAGNGLPVIY